MSPVTLVGRSSSHYTRIAKIFATELGVPYTFRPVLDITTLDTSAYGENPALKVPVLVDDQGPLFGTENICRELLRRSGRGSDIVMRGDVRDRDVANVEELTLHVMTSEVSLIMAKMAGDPSLAPAKASRSIENSLEHLDQKIDAALAALPADRALSFLEVSLFCLLTHLPFREVMDVTKWQRLGDFTKRFSERESAKTTTYRFDAA